MSRMTSLEFKKLDIDFSERLEKTDEELYAQIEKGASREDLQKLINQAENLIIEHARILNDLDDHMGSKFEKSNKENMADLKARLRSQGVTIVEKTKERG